MASDIKLDEHVVTIEAGMRLDVNATDVVLDHPDRRKATGGLRRALVHGFKDELVINFGQDYPGGTRLDGDVSAGDLSADKVSASTLSAKKLEYEVVEHVQGPEGVPNFRVTMVSVSEVVTALEGRIAALEARIDELTK